MRELVEETGYSGSAPVLVRTFFTDPTSASGRFHLFVVRDAKQTHQQQFDPNEEIEVELAPPAEVRAMALDGRIGAGSQVAAALVALDYLGREAPRPRR